MGSELLPLMFGIEDLANELKDGHLTIFRFTSHWKVMLGTPNLESSKGRYEVASLPAYDTLTEALSDIICNCQKKRGI